MNEVSSAEVVFLIKVMGECVFTVDNVQPPC